MATSGASMEIKPIPVKRSWSYGQHFTKQMGFRNKSLTEREHEHETNSRKSSMRAKADHAFLINKRNFGFAKVSNRFMMKNRNRLFILAALANLFMVRHDFLRLQHERCV